MMKKNKTTQFTGNKRHCFRREDIYLKKKTIAKIGNKARVPTLTRSIHIGLNLFQVQLSKKKELHKNRWRGKHKAVLIHGQQDIVYRKS